MILPLEIGTEGRELHHLIHLFSSCPRPSRTRGLGGSMRMKREQRPNSAQPPPKPQQTPHSPQQLHHHYLNLPSRAMSLSMKSSPESTGGAGSSGSSGSSQARAYNSLSNSYSNPKQRTPLNPELHRLQNHPPDWSDCKPKCGDL